MKRFAFNKLIRDRILDMQLAEGSKPKYRILDEKEHLEELIKKLSEEAGEIANAAPEDAASEVADVQQVLDDIRERLGIKLEDVRREQSRKNQKFGPFKKGVFVEYVDVDENNSWVAYYHRNAGRYPEIK